MSIAEIIMDVTEMTEGELQIDFGKFANTLIDSIIKRIDELQIEPDLKTETFILAISSLVALSALRVENFKKDEAIDALKHICKQARAILNDVVITQRTIN